MSDIGFQSATRLAAAIRDRKIGSRELEDRTPIAFAQHLAELIGGFEAPPGY